ncbi:MAG TPA: MBL fold metallo-hydrolase [Actinotalea sp.]|nr:MBL fold metallo-hydrolase [Actinotalea sp.]
MPGWAWAVLLTAAGLVVADRLVARYGRPDGPRRRTVRPASGGGGPLGELIALFQPGMRHLHEESERQRHDLVVPGDADPAWRVDLEAGTAVVPRPMPPDHTCRLVQVAPTVWTHTAATWSSVSTVVVAPDGTCLVVDPTVTPQDLAALGTELALHGWTTVAGFSTHPHWDHVLWSSALGDGPRWATPEAVAVARSTRDTLVLEAEAVAPGHDHRLTGRLEPLPGDAVPWDGPRAVVLPYPGHCPGSAALLLPEARVLLAGDAVSDREVPLLAPDATDPVGDYRGTLDLLERAATGVEVVVPGHGTACDAAGLRVRLAADRAYLDALEAGDTPPDPRLRDPEQAEVHAEQHRLLHGG